MACNRQFKREFSFKKQLKWIIPTVLVAVVIGLIMFFQQNASVDTLLGIKRAGRYLLIGMVGIFITTIFYSFTGIFKCKTGWRCLITAIMLSACIFWYTESRKPDKVHYMQEDILYVKPKSSIE